MLTLLALSFLFKASFSAEIDDYQNNEECYCPCMNDYSQNNDQRDYDRDGKKYDYEDEGEKWQYVYEQIPECVRNNCNDELLQCAETNECVSGVEGIANKCFTGNTEASVCMEDIFKSGTMTGAAELCNGDSMCASDLQTLGQCVMSNRCHSNYIMLKKLVHGTKFLTVPQANGKRVKWSRRVKQRRRLKWSPKKWIPWRGAKKNYVESQCDCPCMNDDDQNNDEYNYSPDGHGNDEEGCIGDQCVDETRLDISPCITDNCETSLISCSQDQNCHTAVEGIVSECESDPNGIEGCVENVFINDVEQGIIDSLCSGDSVCADSFNALGQCVIKYGCHKEEENNQEYRSFKPVLKAVKYVRKRKSKLRTRK